MPETKIIAVVGATGAQGGGLVRTIVNDASGGFTARAITRNVNAYKAKDLAGLGAEVIAADVDNLESLKKAFQGAYGAFFPREGNRPSHRHGHGSEGRWPSTRHLVHVGRHRKWVPLSDNRMPTLMGKYKVLHMDAKGEANEVFTTLGVPTTFLLTSFYWENLIYFGMGPKKDQDGKLAITFPMGDKKLSGIAAEDIGKCALGVFKKGHEYIGKTVGIAGEHLTCAQMAAALTKALNQEVRYNDVPPEMYRSFGFPFADDLGNMFQYFRDFAPYFSGARNIDVTRALNPALQTFEQWLVQNKGSIPLEA